MPRTFEGIELCSVGMEWRASTGPVTFTFEHLADAMAAANDDPHIQIPRLKLGHESGVNGTDGQPQYFDPFAEVGDAAPSFGRVTNLRLEQAGSILVGDYIDVPDWLADNLQSSYPNRSVEVTWNVTTDGGKTYSAVITAVALLGAYLPAVTSLDDLEGFLTEGPSGVAAALPTLQGGPMPQRQETVEASVSAGTIRERFNFDWAMDPDNEFELDGETVSPYWWWAIDVRVDPSEVIADDDNGNLWSIPFSTDGADGVTFSEPVRVRTEYIPVSAVSATSVAATVSRRSGQRVLASSLERPEKPAPTTAASRSDNEEESMSLNMEALRERLGLPEDATEEQINDALLTAEVEETITEPEGTDEETTDPEAEEVTEPELVTASADSPTIQVDKGVWEETQRQAQEGAAARAEQLTEERERVLDSAVKAGKIAPASKDAWRDKLKATPEATSAELEALPTGLVPVDEKGAAVGHDDAQMTAVMNSFGHGTNKEGDR